MKRGMRVTFMALALAVAGANTAVAQTTTQQFSPGSIGTYCREYVSPETVVGFYEWNGLNCYGDGSPRELLGEGDPYAACHFLTETDRVIKASRGINNSLVCEFLKVEHGTVIPSFYVTHVVYAPPGDTSNVTYSEGDTVGSTTSTTRSFKGELSVKANSEVGFIGIAGGSVSVKVGTSWGNTSQQSTDVAVTSTVAITTPGAFDFVDPANGGFQSHGNDEIWFLVKPRLNVAITPTYGSIPKQVEWSFAQQNLVHYFVYVRQLLDPSIMPENVRSFLDSQGITSDYYPQLLEAHPFVRGKYPNTWMDPARFHEIGTFPYVPPPRPEDMPTRQAYTLARTIQNQSTEIRERSLNTAIEIAANVNFIETFKGSLTYGLGMTWTHSTAQKNSVGDSLGHSFTLTQPPFGYQGPTLVRVYLDKIWKTFIFSVDYF